MISSHAFTGIQVILVFHLEKWISKRLQGDELALVSTVWNEFIGNSQNFFKPYVYITKDEELVSRKAI